MKIPVNLLAFLLVAGVFYLCILPKRTRFVSALLETVGVHGMSREDSSKAVVEKRIVADLCPKADLAEYRSMSWTEYHSDNAAGADITHTFTCDGQMRKYLFRLRYGSISEIIDLR